MRSSEPIRVHENVSLAISTPCTSPNTKHQPQTTHPNLVPMTPSCLCVCTPPTPIPWPVLPLRRVWEASGPPPSSSQRQAGARAGGMLQERHDSDPHPHQQRGACQMAEKLHTMMKKLFIDANTSDSIHYTCQCTPAYAYTLALSHHHPDKSVHRLMAAC